MGQTIISTIGVYISTSIDYLIILFAQLYNNFMAEKNEFQITYKISFCFGLSFKINDSMVDHLIRHYIFSVVNLFCKKIIKEEKNERKICTLYRGR